MDKALSKFKELVKEAGGSITHEYSLIKGFSMQLPFDFTDGVIKKLNAAADELGNNFHLERDSEVHVFSGHAS